MQGGSWARARRRRVRRLIGSTVTVLLVVPMLGFVASAPAAGEDTEGSGMPSLTPVDTEIRVAERRAVPARTARKGVRAYPVPTSEAGVRRITTAPDGSMWFTELDANRIGRITRSGAITEYELGEPTASNGWVLDLDVGPDGDVWIVWDSGWQFTRFDPAQPENSRSWKWEDYPYGEQVRVGPGNIGWVTASYGDDAGIVRVEGDSATWGDNAPPCDGALGRGRDGRMWCQSHKLLYRVAPDGNGGQSVPLPHVLNTKPLSIAPGPNGRVWFGRDTEGSFLSHPHRGNVGWVRSDGSTRVIKLGYKTSVRSLVRGPNRTMWFTNVGGEPAIGHVNRKGRGAITRVGGWEPTALTVDKRGAIWFTDSENNHIVRVAPRRLRRTNIDLGRGSQLKPHRVARPKLKSRKLNANRRRTKAKGKIKCTKGDGRCVGKIKLKKRGKKLGKGKFRLASGKKRRFKVKLNRKARRWLRKKRRVKRVKVVLKPRQGPKVKKRVVLKR